VTDSIPNDSLKTFTSQYAWLVNPNEQPRQNVRISVVEGIVADIADVPADERPLIRPIAILPRFVNAHTHLEFSQLSEPVTPAVPFPDWIRSVIRYRISRPEAGFVADSVRAGVLECRSGSTALVGEITTSNAGRETLQQLVANSQMSAISFRELIGFRKESIADQLVIATQSVSASGAEMFPNVVPGLSPHAPYSVHPELFEAIVDCAKRHDVPVAMHLGETLDEIELLSHRSGRFVDFLSSMNLGEPASLGNMNSLLPYLQKLAQNRISLAVHCNYPTDAEIRFLGEHQNVAVVYCPRTHAYFGHSQHPWRKMIDAGATVILGTDSKASNPDLSIWKELQLAGSQSNVPPIWELLPLITTAAATALGQSQTPYKISVGLPYAATTVTCACDSLSILNATLLSDSASILN